ncbi:putative C6 transcription factor [Rosellinia necatrix]|uniref:Putative C6 transcription factor n=1 Tax=Rosellinia necatrix TaxID=77044 RepID=A0A1W2TNQ5_ROSNE|nr:putative C6 transcription factor [Rosellinia necatrix]
MTPSSRPSQPPADRATSSRSPTRSRVASPSAPDLAGDNDSSIRVTETQSPRDTAQDDLEPPSDSSSRPGPPVPLQQRRRVTRACDECRRKKIKCDGKQPCTHCQVYSYECTYDKPSNRRRNPAPQYIEALENKLSRAETLLRKFMPDVDLNDPNLDPAVQQEFRMREQARQKAAAAQRKDQAKPGASEGQLQSMISSAGQLDLSDSGDYDFHGTSSGSVFFKQMKKHFRTLLGKDYQIPFMPRPPRPSGVTTLDSPRPTPSSPWATTPGPSISNLPPKERAIALCTESLDNATCLLRIVHKPTFYGMLDSLYDKPSDEYGTEDNRNLALAYSAMALGCMYDVSDDAVTRSPPYKISIDEALNYYSSARYLLQDITECRDLVSLQALLFMILFLQSISNLSTCYGFVGIALRSALRMGLHRHLPHIKLDPVESETRRRVFYICRQMDTYVSALLGFPLLLNDDDIDQLLPTAVDDQFITREGITTPPAGTPSYIEAFNAHVKLMDLLSKVVKHVYPLKRIDPKVADGDESQYASYMVSYARIKEMEEELQQWNEQLPFAWRPNPDGPAEVVRIRNLLRFAFAHVQMVLYRPFLHYVSPRFCAGKDVSERAYACGAAYITVARNIVHIGTEMRRQVSLVGPYWFTLFSEFFAIISLVFFVLENQDKPGSKEILADAIAGKNMISELAAKSMVADRISQSLETLFDQLPVNLKDFEAQAVPSKKRPRSGVKLESSPSVKKASSPGSSRGASKGPSLSKAISAKMQKRSPTVMPHSGPLGNEHILSPDFDAMFSGSFHFPPSDMTVASQDSIATAALSDAGQTKLQHGTTGAAQQIHRLDAIMFPSDDPLAYPNQPRADFGMHGSGLHTNPGDILPHDPSSYYVPHLYDGIEGQLLGPLPPYLMQPQGGPGIPFSAQMYSDPMLPSQQMHPSPLRPHVQGLQLEQEQLRRQPGDYDHMLANTSWQGMFPPHGMD